MSTPVQLPLDRGQPSVRLGPGAVVLDPLPTVRVAVRRLPGPLGSFLIAIVVASELTGARASDREGRHVAADER